MILGRRLRPVGEAVPRLDLRGLLSPSTESATSRHEHFLNLPFTGWRTFAYASGTAALAAAITTAIRHKCTARPQVIVPAYACPDVVSAAVFAGARPVLADTLPNSPWLDPAAVADLTTADTVAVVYLRFLGLPANDLSLRAAIGNSGALLIEDCAHFFPTNPCIESSADLLAFSFGRGKPVSVRSGGMLLQRTESCAAFLVPCLTAIKPDTGLARVAHWARCLLYNTCIEPHARRLLADTILFDGHNDLPWTIRTDKKAPSDIVAYDLRKTTTGQTDIARLRQGGLGAQFWSVYTPGEATTGLARTQLEQIDLMLKNLAYLSTKTDIWLRLLQFLSPIVFIGAAVAGIWNARIALRSGRKWYAKVWAVVLALSFLAVLWVAWNYHLMKFGVDY